MDDSEAGPSSMSGAREPEAMSHRQQAATDRPADNTQNAKRSNLAMDSAETRAGRLGERRKQDRNTKHSRETWPNDDGLATMDKECLGTGIYRFQPGDYVAIASRAACSEIHVNSPIGPKDGASWFFDKVASVDSVTPTGDVKVTFGRVYQCTIASEHLFKMPSLLPGDIVKLVDDVRGDGNLQLENGDQCKSATKAYGHICLVLEGGVKEPGEIYATVGEKPHKFRPFHLDFVARPLYGDFLARLTKYASNEHDSACLGENLLRALQGSMQDLPVVDTSASSKSSPYLPGNVVKISSDVHQFIRWQQKYSTGGTQDPAIAKFQTLQDHARSRLIDSANGPFPTEQVESLLEPGKVVDVNSDGDAIVEFSDGRAWSIRTSFLQAVEGSDAWGEGRPSCSSMELSKGIDRLINHARNRGDETLLHAACFAGKMELIKLTLQRGVDLECEDDDGNKPLHYAAHGNQPDVINFLLSEKAKINATNKHYHTALQFAVKEGYLNCVRELTKRHLELDPDIKDDNGNTALHVAIARMNSDIVNEIADLRVNFTIRNKYGLSTLHMAALKGNSMAVEKILLKKKILVNDKQGDQGYAALHFAAVKGHYEVVESLLKEESCAVDLPTKHQETALLLAASEGHGSIVESLLLAGANINRMDRHRNTALHMTLKKMKERPAKPLDTRASRAMKATQHVHTRRMRKETAAVEQKLLSCGHTDVEGRLRLACLLARSGADINCPNEDGKTPLNIFSSMTDLPEEILREFHVERRDADSGKCKYCLEVPHTTYFTPCGHSVSCEDCGQRMKHCLSCGKFITGRVPAGIPARLGQRVVRGPDWKWENQDGGDGHVGTVIAIEPSLEDHDTSSSFVRVMWDIGQAGDYRASRNGPCDLRLYDSGPVGIAFPTVTCVPCRTIGIIGTRWKCSVCVDYNLCHSCYMKDKHLLDHAFLRFDAPGAEGAKVPPRQGSIKIEVRGIFEGAKVARGRDWIWNNQDGGEGNVGTVVTIGNWNAATVRSHASVRWNGMAALNYRLGLGGAVDLKCTEPALGCSFYKDHMPLIGLEDTNYLHFQQAPVDVSRTEIGMSGFRTGEQVSVQLEAEHFERLQQGHGEWNPGMEQIINKLGTVQQDTPQGDVRVNFGPFLTLTINPAALTRVSRQGCPTDAQKPETSGLQHACFIGDEQRVKKLVAEGADLEEQDSNGHRPIHFAAYGNKPEILSFLISQNVDANAQNKRKTTALHIAVEKEFVNCIRVLIESAPLLDVKVPDENGSTALHKAVQKKSEAAIEMLVNVCGDALKIKNHGGFNVLHLAAFQGNNFAVKQILSKMPDLVNVQRRDGCAALHIAAINGYHDVVKTLLNQGNCEVDLETTKQETPLVLAVSRGYCDIVELLVQARADINKPNAEGDTAMHMSLLRRSEVQPHCVKASTSPAVAAVMYNIRETSESEVDLSIALACFLANHGGDLSKMNKKGQSPLRIAKTNVEVALLLKWNQEKCEATSRSAAVLPECRPGIGGSECKSCRKRPANVRFEPCGDRLFCEECCNRMLYCVRCDAKIARKVAIEERVLP
ncbi:uncharacterized protein LOC144147089 [Haemaphysalis longicornis]